MEPDDEIYVYNKKYKNTPKLGLTLPTKLYMTPKK